ncbi:unnamed protein product [Candidula unifasciata]|uniref:C-type lectin domain-containing protein n=1 Tax=Candidula unifasciata TaxID=100452 RepID=A0A8S3ZWU1_9EUPU|nr:unnamed protein product [Candidula unifasciata]
MIKSCLILALMFQCALGACWLGWVEFKGVCYSFNPDYLPWLSAQASCQLYGARLIQVDSQEKQEWLEKTLKETNLNNVWIGGTCRLHQSTWFWVPSYRPIKNYTNWLAGQPGNPSAEQCIQVYSGYQYKWNDLSCLTALQYVCEKIGTTKVQS